MPKGLVGPVQAFGSRGGPDSALGIFFLFFQYFLLPAFLRDDRVTLEVYAGSGVLASRRSGHGMGR